MKNISLYLLKRQHVNIQSVTVGTLTFAFSSGYYCVHVLCSRIRLSLYFAVIKSCPLHKITPKQALAWWLACYMYVFVWWVSGQNLISLLSDVIWYETQPKRILMLHLGYLLS